MEVILSQKKHCPKPKFCLVLVYPIPEAGILVGREFMNIATFGSSLINGLSFDKWLEKNKNKVK